MTKAITQPPGSTTDPARKRRHGGEIASAFAEPYRYTLVTTAGFHDDAGFCEPCDAPYCQQHWNVSSSGYGTCPGGHGNSLDALSWPDDL